MGIIDKIKTLIGKKHEQQEQSQVQEYIQHQRDSHKIDALMKLERNSFLNPNGDWNNE